MLRFWLWLPVVQIPLLTGQDTAVIRTTVDVVNVVCTVRDRKDNYRPDLTLEDFEVLEDGVPQLVDLFHREFGTQAQPLSLILLMDTSGSVKEKLSFEQQAANEFLRSTLRINRDMAAIVQFDSEVNLVQDFTYDYDTLETSIFAIRAGGATKLYDPIWLAVEELLHHEVGRKMMVVLSDGDDTQSSMTDKEATRSAQNEDVVIYGIGIKGSRFRTDFAQLKRFARATGGMFFNPRADAERLQNVFQRINREIKNQYSLGYVSSNNGRDGSFRKIEVRIKGRGRKGWKIRHREGYYAPHDES